MRVAVLGGSGKTGRAITTALEARATSVTSIGRRDWGDLADALHGCDAVSVIAPNFHPDEPAYVAHALEACRAAGVSRVGYHSVASPYVPAMAHHLGKAEAEDLVRRSGLAWTILQPGVYVQNLDLSRPVAVPYDVHATFGFLDLADLGEAVATVLLEDGHVGATYELASRSCSVADLAAGAGTTAARVDAGDVPGGLRAMFAYYDAHGLPAGTLPLRALLGRP